MSRVEVRSVGQVIRHFEGIGKVPVDIKDVLETMKSICPHLNIKIRGVDVDPKRLHGNCYNYRVDDAQILVPKFISMVVYSTQDHPFMQRFVCCKELVNIMDPAPMYTRTKQGNCSAPGFAVLADASKLTRRRGGTGVDLADVSQGMGDAAA